METCFRNGENVFFSMLRLCLEKPFILEEILPQPPPTSKCTDETAMPP
jgi:hypothetical protein